MVETERLQKEGVISPEFLKPELICDFFVDEKRKKIWAINIDLYNRFSDICDKYGLRYYAYAGTLLGAIRHHGFIPWDDDMDVCMPRNDYEKFIEIANVELSDPYFLQTVKSDLNYFRTIIRLINKNTTCLPVAFRHSNAINGIPLDIFPLDDCNPEVLQQELERIQASAIRCSSYMKRNDTNIMNEEQLVRWQQSMTENPIVEWQKIQDIAKCQYATEYYSMKVFIIRGGRYNLPLKKEWFEGVKKVRFENIEIQVPADYDKVLKTIYGNYMQYPPVENRGTWHDGVIMDADRSFIYYT